MFDELNNPLRLQLLAGIYAQPEWAQFVDTQQRVRASCSTSTSRPKQQDLASVDLPSFVKTYAGRVVETWRSASRGVVADSRPSAHDEAVRRGGKSCCSMATTPIACRRAARFRDDASQVHTRRIAAAGLANARKHHTSEHRVSQVLEWIATGITPAYWDRSAAERSKRP